MGSLKSVYLDSPKEEFIGKLADGMKKINPKIREDRKTSKAIQLCIDLIMKLDFSEVLKDYRKEVNSLSIKK